jgi:hypothetical protein
MLARCQMRYLYKCLHEMAYVLPVIRAMRSRNKEKQHSIYMTCRPHVVDQMTGEELA